MSESKKKILFIIPCFKFGGTNTSLSALLKELKNKFDCEIFSMSNDGETRILFKKHKIYTNWLLDMFQCDYKNSKSPYKILIFLIKCIKRFLLFFNIDITSYLYKRTVRNFERENKHEIIIGFEEGDATAFASFFKNKNKIAWIHCDYSYYMKSDESKIYDKFKKIVCVSEYTANVFKEIYPLIADKTTCLYNLCDYDKIVTLSNEAINDSRFINNTFTIVSIGRINKIKRFEYIPQIASILKDEGLSFKWYIIGSGNDKELNDKIGNNIKHYNVTDEVILLGHKNNVYPYIKNSNLLVSLSISEACPMIFIEARALNCPIVSADFKTAYEFIENEKNGLIEPIEYIHKAISRLIKEEETYKKFKQVNYISCNNSNNYINKILTFNI